MDAVDMWAKLVEAEMHPSRIDVAARAVKYDLIPDFEAQRGARLGFWMANRTSGEVLVVTIWSDRDSLDAGGSADGTNRANIAERTGLSVRAVQTMEVLIATDPDLTATPRRARATWIGGVATDRGRDLAAMRACGGYWFGDATTGAGLVLSLRDGPLELRGEFDCTVSRVSTYESLGVARRFTDSPDGGR